MRIQLQNVSKRFGALVALDDVTLTIPAGARVALAGSNGSGKSTLVRAVTGLLPHTRGAVRLFGTPIEDFRDWHRLGFVPQRSSAAGGVPATVREVVASGRVGRRKLLRPTGASDRAAVQSALEVVGLADRAAQGVSQLSGGQQQRALIARALAGQPDLFFLDEPTAGVDLPNQLTLARSLGRLKESGATIVLVAHELGPLAGLVDRSVVMRDGRVAYDGAALADHAVHSPDFGESHAHHHHPDRARHDHVPRVAAPFEGER
jgi:zinc transport system ATP-binding protein